MTLSSYDDVELKTSQKEKKQQSSKGLLTFTVQIRSGINLKELSISFEVTNAIVDPAVTGYSTLEAAINDISHKSVAGSPVSRHVILGGHVGSDHDVMARGLGVPGCHPKPESGLEGNEGVIGNHFWVPESVEAQGLACGPIVVVPRELHWASAFVGLAGVAGPLGVGGVAVVAARADLFFETQSPGVGSIRGGGPAASGLVGDLSEKGSDFTLAGG